jgi:hypothetical protein
MDAALMYQSGEPAYGAALHRVVPLMESEPADRCLTFTPPSGAHTCAGGAHVGPATSRSGVQSTIPSSFLS